MDPALTTPDERIFISYDRTDEDAAIRLTNRLRHYGVKVSSPDLMPGDDLISGIADAIASASAVVVLIGRDTARSPWVGSEIAMALVAQQDNPSLKIIPVLLDDDADIPILLQGRQYLNISDGREDAWEEVLKAVRSQPHEGRGLGDPHLSEQIAKLQLDNLAIQREHLRALELLQTESLNRSGSMLAASSLAVTGTLAGVVAIVGLGSLEFSLALAATALAAVASFATLFFGVWLRSRSNSGYKR